MKRIYLLVSFILFLIPCKLQAQWTLLDTIDAANFINIHFLSADTGFISGELDQRILRTTDGGQTWDSVATPIPQFSGGTFDMQFINSQTGFACGGSLFAVTPNFLLSTTDGGLSWQQVENNNPCNAEFTGLDFKDENTGIVFSYHFLLGTTDGGYTMQVINKPHPNYMFNDAILLPDNRIIVAGYNNASGNTVNSICYSSDWGTTWDTAYISATIGIQSLCMSGSTGWAGCSKGRILRSTDNGISWAVSLVAEDSLGFRKMKTGQQGNTVYGLAYKVNGEGHLYASVDAGATWQHQQLPGVGVDISFPSADTGYMITYRELYKTTSGGGITFLSQKAPNENAITVYPNPFTEKATISFKGKKVKTVNIYNASGTKVQHYNNVAGKPLTIGKNGLAAGFYFISCFDDRGNEMGTSKFVVE